MRTFGTALLAAAILLAPGDEPASGYDRFVARQTDAAKVAARKRDWTGAIKAWKDLLELDRDSIAGLSGLADAAQAANNKDQELQARLELADVLARAVAAGQKDQERPLEKVQARLKEIDPKAGAADALLVAYSDAQKQLGIDYEAAGFPANAILAWGRRSRLVLPGSPEFQEAATAIDHLRRTSPSYVAERFDPGVVLETRDEAWIADVDKKTSKFSSGLKMQTPHYRFKTNAGWRLLQAVAGAMERVQVFYRDVWGIVPDPKPEKVPDNLHNITVPPLDVNIYKTRYEYTHVAGEGDKDWSGGHFTGSALETYDQGDGGGGNGIPATLQVMFHEASHQFMDVCVGGVPSFVNEGVASLFEGIQLLPNGELRRDLPVPHYLLPLARKIRDGSARKLRDIFKAPENKPELYEYRWGVFYFVRMYVDAGGHYPFRDKLVDYIYQFKKGELGDLVANFEDFFLKPANLPGLKNFDEFEATWRQWILDLDDEQRHADKRLGEYRERATSVVRNEPAEALPFCERALDIDPDDAVTLRTTAEACDGLDQKDRALATWRRVLDGLDEADPERAVALKRVAALDPLGGRFDDAIHALAGGMAGLARDYDEAKLPLAALRCASAVLRVDPFEASARALVTRLERDEGLSTLRWQRLCNGFDLRGWYGKDQVAYRPVDDGVTADSARRTKTDQTVDAGALLYQTLLCTRQVTGDWSYQAHIKCDKDWQLVGLVFGSKDSTHYEAIALRKGPDGITRVDHGSYVDEAWTFPHTDGAVKSDCDPTAGVDLRIDVRGRAVAVTINGKPVLAMVDKQAVPAVKYPLAALHGDIGLLASGGLTTFTAVRLLAGSEH